MSDVQTRGGVPT